MYRKLKNIMGISLMILAVLLAQLPMPETQAEKTITVTFSMNGGKYSGTYNGYTFKNQVPVLVLDGEQRISEYPSDAGFSYDGFRSESGKWYTDIECLNEFDKSSKVTESITLYKKWYNITSDGQTLAATGFYLNPDKTILYKYDGDSKHVEIPDTVTTIATSAFDDLSGVRGITLPKNIVEIQENAFGEAHGSGNIIYIYDSGTVQSKSMGRMLDDSYDQLVYSSYLDIKAVETIVGIDYGEDSEIETEYSTEETSETESETMEAVSSVEAETEEVMPSDEAKTTEASTRSVVATESQSSEEEETDSEEESEPETVAADIEESESETTGADIEENEEETIEANTEAAENEVADDTTSLMRMYSMRSIPKARANARLNTEAAIEPKIEKNQSEGNQSKQAALSVETDVPQSESATVFAETDEIQPETTTVSTETEEAQSEIPTEGTVPQPEAMTVSAEVKEPQPETVTAPIEVDGTQTESIPVAGSEESIENVSTEYIYVTCTAQIGGRAEQFVSNAEQQVENASERIRIAKEQAAKEQAALEAEAAASDPLEEAQETITKTNVSSASAPKSDVHVKDSTPKTGDPLEYRMLLVCCLFCIGALLLLTGNGRKRKTVAS